MNYLKNILKLMRVKHWLKNFLVFFPLVFSTQIFHVGKLTTATLGFISMCLITSVVYIINDLKDVEKDRLHPIKKNRPFASGAISINNGLLIMFILLTITILINIFFIKNYYALTVLLIYLFANIGYSFGLKNVPIIDILILVSGFVIRVVYGSLITNIEISKWLYLTIMSGSFFMGFGKRRNEMIKQGSKSRDVLKYYTKDYLDKFMYVSIILTVVFYSLWGIDKATILRIGNDYIIYTIPLVLVIIMKYSLNIEGDSHGDPVDVITSDKVLLFLSLLFFIMMFLIIYIF